jgi:hypothetical protein
MTRLAAARFILWQSRIFLHDKRVSGALILETAMRYPFAHICTLYLGIDRCD